MLLNGEYKLYQFEDGEDFSLQALRSRTGMVANVPCNVETVLHRYGLLCNVYTDDPKAAERYEDCDWAFEKTFNLERMETGKAVLIFKGVDTLFEVFLNGVKIGEGDSEMIGHSFDVTDVLKMGENSLVVHIFSTVKKAYTYENSPITVPTFSGSSDGLHIRKAAHSFGWDIYPRIVSAGITKDVELVFEKEVDFERVYLATQYVDEKTAVLECFYALRMQAKDRNLYRLRVQFLCKESQYVFEYNVDYKSSTKYMGMGNPILWWPNGMGEQNLYDVTFTLLNGEKTVAEKKIRFGIKRLELKREATCGDRDQFCFYINGRYFKCLGSNIVPPDILHAGIAEKYEALVRDLKNSHTNMVRVWGGGVYLDEKFYELCDEAGIVIWQDFMLSCHSYPITDALKTALQREAEEVIKTYGAHTSLGLYCGSNETDWAFYCTGLDPNQDVYTREIFPKAVFKQDPNHIYLPSSPYFSKEYYQQYGGTFLLDLAIIEENRKALSEEHYWWHREDYRTFANMKHNFVSEIGYSGAPSLATIRSFSGTDGEIDRKKFNYTTEGEIDYGVKYYFTDEPTSAEDFVFASQVYQAEAYKFLMEQARTRDALNGVLLWTFNEGFPSFTSGLVDYYGDKKLAWYYVKNAQEPVQTVVVERDEKLVGFVVNNTVKAVSGNVAVYDEKGERLGEYAFSVAETSAKELFSMEKEAGFLVMETRVGDKCVYNHFSVQKKYALQAYKNFMENYKNKLFGM